MTVTTDRRALLRGIVATAAASATLATPMLAAASTGSEPVLAAWRQWWALGQEAGRLTDEMLEIWETLPEQVRWPTIFLYHNKWSKEDVYGRTEADIWKAWPGETAGPSLINEPPALAAREAKRNEKLIELKAAREAAEAEMQRAGYAQLDDRIKATFEEQYALEEIIKLSASPAPAVLVAKLSVAMSRTTKGVCELDEWMLVRSVVASLLPSVPADMAEAMAPIVPIA